MKDNLSLSESSILQLRFNNPQTQLVDSSLENLELKKQLLLLDRINMENNFSEFKKEISEEYEINYDDYYIDFARNKLVPKK